MSLFSNIAEFLKPAPPLSPLIREALLRVGKLVDPLLPGTSGFEHKLASPLEYALGYCDGLIAALPGPIDLSRQTFSTDPLVHALFATGDDVDQMLGRSQAVRDYLNQPCSWESDYFYTLFAARRQQKKQLGMAVEGEVLHTDVPQMVVYFSGQTLIEPSCSLEITLQGLRQRALDSLLTSFHEHLESLRSERDGMRSDLSIERAHLNVLHGDSDNKEYAIRSRHVAELDAHLRATAESMLPEHLLQSLADFLRTPESSLSLASVSITVDRLGIVREENSTDSNIHTLNFPELTSRDKRLHLVMLARIDREEARAAVERVRDQQHRFMLI
jgi:hypothetical protein